jgi:hypothetical protein
VLKSPFCSLSPGHSSLGPFGESAGSEGPSTLAEATLDDMNGSSDNGDVIRQFDPEKLVVAVNQCFEGFHFSIQTCRPEISYADRLKAWFEARAAAETRGVPFTEPGPVLSYTGPATFDSCAGEERESGFVLKLSMKAGSGRPFSIFIEEDTCSPKVVVNKDPILSRLSQRS